MAGPLVCSIAARRDAARVRVLARSVRRHHPDARVVVLAADDVDHRWDDALEPFELRRPDDLPGLPVAELWRAAAALELDDLVSALLPYLLRALVAEHGGPVLHLAPSMVVHAPVDDLVAGAAGDRRLVTPQLLHPIPRDTMGPTEAAVLASGAYNLGVLAVGPGPTTDALLAWWAERRGPGLDDHAPADQRWFDLAATLFPVEVVRDPGCNVGWWNLHERPLERDPDGRWLAAGQPLRLFNAAGFDPSRPGVLVDAEGWSPRVTPASDPALAELLDELAPELLGAGHRLATSRPSGWDHAGPLRLDPTMRRVYRHALVAAETIAGPAGAAALPGEPPNPFAPGGPESFTAWLRERQPVGASRYLVGLHAERADLQAAFGPLSRESAATLTSWAAHDEAVVLRSDPLVLPATGVDVADRPVRGVNLAGFLDAELGIGEAARLLADGLWAAGEPVATRILGGHRSRRRATDAPADAGTSPYDLSLVAVNADLFPLLDLHGIDPGWGPRIGLWFWETDELPERFDGAFAHVDEVWTASRFTAAAIQGAVERIGADVVVRTVPLPVARPGFVPALTRHDLGLPPGRLHLFSFDLQSAIERKNPYGLLEAYREAFRVGDGACLVLKTINGHLRPAELEALRRATADRPDVHVVDGYVASHQRWGLMAAADVYVSLHKAEGLGLTLAEAMVLGVPVVATGWSGSLELADERTAWLVPVDLVPVPVSSPAYAGCGRWAEPDLGAAAATLVHLAEHPDEAAAKAAFARDHLARTRTAEACAPAIAAALAEARQRGPRPGRIGVRHVTLEER